MLIKGWDYWDEQKPFEPYAAVVNERGESGWSKRGTVCVVIGKTKGGWLTDNQGFCFGEGGVDRIINPTEAHEILASLGYCNYYINKKSFLDKIASLRTSPPELKPLDEAAIRADEREKVIEEVRKHVDLNPQLFLGTVYRDDLQRFLLDTLKGGDGE